MFLVIDEYILPKIAERDLRRFANLRLTSSEAGMNLPLHEVLLVFVINQSSITVHAHVDGLQLLASFYSETPKMTILAQNLSIWVVDVHLFETIIAPP